MLGVSVLVLVGLYLWGVVSRVIHPARLLVTIENHESTALEDGCVFVPDSKYPDSRPLRELGPIAPGSKVAFEVKHVDNADVLLRFRAGAGGAREGHLAYLIQGDTVSVVVVAQGDSLEVSRISRGHYR